jgi:hypothetical protein
MERDWPLTHKPIQAHGQERSEHRRPLNEASINCKVHFHSKSPKALGRSGSLHEADHMQDQGCMTSMAWLPWVTAAMEVGCAAALKGLFCTAVSAPVEGFRTRPDTVLPRKFEV